MTDIQQISKLIVKWRINQAVLAERIGMNKNTFLNKRSPNHYTKFSPAELERLKKVLKDMGSDLAGIKN